jgi:methionyl aminopeptidase
MRASIGNTFSSNGLIKLKNQDWLDKQRVAGKLAARALLLLESFIKGKTFHSMATLTEIAERYITEAGGTCTFKGYKGFPAGVCVSINKQLVHGIPDDTVLDDGDIVSFDLGVTYQGAIADTAITCIFGTPKSDRHVALVKATEEALMKGIEAVEVGKRLGSIGYAISRHAKNKGFGCITKYGGHGLDWDIPHAAPFVANEGSPNDGLRIQPGLAIAIEPMLVLGSTNTKTLSDGWTVVTDDVGAHFEHSIFVHNDHIEIITDRTGLTPLGGV